jgi:3-oxoacyl-[acyl-carrier protein] reductase
MRIKDKVVVITGSGRGIGRVAAEHLAREGAKVVVADMLEAEGRQLVDEITRANGAAIFQRLDVSNEAEWQAAIGAALAAFGRLDILVNDAAYNKAIPFKDLDSLTYEEWTKILDINLTGPMLVTKAVAPVMKRQGSGRIVNISSVAGLGPTGSSIAYAVSKAGLIHLTKCMAVALAPEVLVNCVAPGLLEGTRATANLRPEAVEAGRKGALLGKAADKDDCADQVVTMCRTNTMTGQTLVIDAGRTFH